MLSFVIKTSAKNNEMYQLKKPSYKKIKKAADGGFMPHHRQHHLPE
jgi:hypothetical protein